MGREIWTVADSPATPPIAYFSTERGAEQYVRMLTERHALGKHLALYGKQLTTDAGLWELGLGPRVFSRPIDPPIEHLPGVWLVKVDEACRMVASEFSTKHRLKSPTHYRTGIHAICEAYGATPQEALDRAKKAMIHYLSKDHAWR